MSAIKMLVVVGALVASVSFADAGSCDRLLHQISNNGMAYGQIMERFGTVLEQMSRSSNAFDVRERMELGNDWEVGSDNWNALTHYVGALEEAVSELRLIIVDMDRSRSERDDLTLAYIECSQ